MADSSDQNSSGSRNTLIASLPQADYDRIEPFLREMPMPFKQVLQEQDEPIRDVIFSGGAVCSLLVNLSDGSVAEIATVGREGAVGTSVFADGADSIHETIVQVGDGAGYAMPVEAFSNEMDEGGAFARAILRFSQALLTQISQNVVCNALHTHEQRGCRWLLMTHDRAGRDSFQLTHEFLGAMIGVRLPSVTLVAHALQTAGLVDFQKGTITILNRGGLEDASCECYENVVKAYNRLP